MAVLESRPFLAPTRRAVRAQIDLLEPDVAIERIGDAWEPGQRIVLRVSAELAPEFWSETSIDRGETVMLVGIASCLPARESWRSRTDFVEKDGAWVAETLVEIDGSIAAVEITADAWVVGPGRTGSADPENAVHAGAKLWKLDRPITLDLESEQAAFPTTAISFSRTGRRDVPWTVEMNPDADPHWNISSAVRLYINTDSDLAEEIVSGTASEDIYALIQSDIHLVVLHRLAAWTDSVPPAVLAGLAETEIESLAAFGATLAQSLGIPLAEALRLVKEEPLGLSTRSREALSFGRRKADA